MQYCLGRKKKRVGEGGQGLFTEGGGGGGGSSWSMLERAEAVLRADQSTRTLKSSAEGSLSGWWLHKSRRCDLRPPQTLLMCGQDGEW